MHKQALNIGSLVNIGPESTAYHLPLFVGFSGSGIYDLSNFSLILESLFWLTPIVNSSNGFADLDPGVQNVIIAGVAGG